MIFQVNPISFNSNSTEQKQIHFFFLELECNIFSIRKKKWFDFLFRIVDYCILFFMELHSNFNEVSQIIVNTMCISAPNRYESDTEHQVNFLHLLGSNVIVLANGSQSIDDIVMWPDWSDFFDFPEAIKMLQCWNGILIRQKSCWFSFQLQNIHTQHILFISIAHCIEKHFILHWKFNIFIELWTEHTNKLFVKLFAFVSFPNI